MPKIPSRENFCGTNNKSITQWLSMKLMSSFRNIRRAQQQEMTRYFISNYLRRCFCNHTGSLNENNAISYEAVKRRLTEKYLGEEYKRHLESKLR